MHRYSFLFFMISLALCSEVLAGEAPLPGTGEHPPVVQPAPMRSNQPMSRSGPAYEVEALSVRAHDPVGLAVWAELAAQGFHVVAAIPQPDGSAVLYLEHVGGMRGEALRLPMLVEQDAPTAAALRARLLAAQAERQHPAPTLPVQGVPPPMPPTDAKKP